MHPGEFCITEVQRDRRMRTSEHARTEMRYGEGTSRRTPCPTEIEGGVAMSKVLRGLAAGWGAKKMGGGCLSTILVFVLLWWLLGHFNLFR